ncbi:MAG: LysR family transcriptional regulator [Rhodocyclaceae bacterium]|nr:LysR family transcriptional regulator [Rhodocyclaceae bacterium]
MDRFDAMRLFVRVAESGSFSAIARQSNLARSVVTRQVAALEALLGAKLLARTTRRLTLTAAGAAYLEKCRVILNLVEAAETDLAEDRQVPRGPIRLSVPLSFGIRHLSPLLLEFAALYPEVALDTEYSDQRSNLFEAGLDLTIRITRRLEPGDVARRISAGHMMVVAAPDYLARHGEPRHPAELIHHECLGYTAAANGQKWDFLIDGQAQNFPVRGRLQANNGDVLLAAAVSGFGIAYEPSFICAAALAAGQVRQILADFPIPELGIYAVLPGNRLVPHRVRVLVDFLAARLERHPPWAAAAPTS